MSIILDVIMITIFLWVVPSAILYNSRRYEYNSIKEGIILQERTMTNYNFWALLFNIKDGHFAESIESFFKRDWKPKSGIDKEIADEEKEIAELERQKEKMDRLAELKRRKEMLFNEVHDSEVSKEYRNCKYCWGENSLKTAVTRDGISYQICTICSSEQ